MSKRECIISDLEHARPADALSSTVRPGRWLAMPYEAEGVSGTMLWAPAIETPPPEIAVPLPDLGLCEIRVGVYGTGESPAWIIHGYGRQRGPKPWKRVCLRLSSDTYYDWLTPDAFAEQPRQYISESYWKTADVSGRSLLFSPPRQEALRAFHGCVAYIRLVPVAKAEEWPQQTKRLVCYYDGNFLGHFVADADDVRSQIMPLRESDAAIVLWNSSREDTCYYPTSVGNVLPDHGVPDTYPHWAGRDLQRMLARGEDPLRVACETAHSIGLRFYSSYRRMTCRVPPFVFPLHPKAMLMTRRDLWCLQADGSPVPQLSLAFPEVRRRTIDILYEQASTYDIDGVHLFFARGVPFTLFEGPFLEHFRNRHGIDPRSLSPMDPRIREARADIFIGFMRELRSGLDRAGDARGRRVGIALTIMNSLEACAWFGMDVARLADERLVDILLPFPCHYLPAELGDEHLRPESVAAIAAVAGTKGIRIYPDCGYDYSCGKEPLERRAARMYEAGADGLQVSQYGVRGQGLRVEDAVARRLGHCRELDMADTWRRSAARPIRLLTVAGMPLDRLTGPGTCG